MSALIEFDAVCKYYQMGDTTVKAADHITMKIEKGEFVAIVGQSGSGKSTCMNIIGCLDVPTAGTYRLNGRDVGKMSRNELASIRNEMLGFIFQQYNLLPKLNLLENVEVPLVYAGIPRAERHRRAREVLEQVGLGDKLKNKPNQLSGGQQQRVSIARALVRNPAIILADEPTGALDSHTGREVLGMLQDLHGQGHTVVLITHEMAVIRQICNKVAILDGGKLAEQGTVDDVFMHTKSAAGRRLFGILPEQEEIPPQPAIRIVFDGEAAEKPIISKLVKDCGLDVNILSADIRQLNQKAYGQMLIARPQDPEDVKRVMEYLALEGLTVEEVHVP